MSDHDDWLDDCIIMDMMDEDERGTGSDGSGGVPGGCGCLPILLLLLAFFFLIGLFM